MVEQFGAFSQAGNVGRTGSSKINQDSVFVSKITSEGKALVSKDAITSAPVKSDWYCGVADGHGQNGHFVSQFIQQHITKQYETEKRRMDRLKQAKQLASSFKSGGGKKDGSDDVIKQAISSSHQQLKQLDAE